MSWHWIDLTASIFPAKCGEFLKNTVKTESLQSYFSVFFSSFQQFRTSESSTFQIQTWFTKQCLLPLLLPVVGVWSSLFVMWWVVFQLQLDDFFSDECKEMCVQMLGIYVLAQEVSLLWCIDHRGVPYRCHCRCMLYEILHRPYSTLCVSKMFMCSIYLP